MRSLLLSLLLFFLAPPLGAQTVRGRLLEQGSGAPVAATLVALVDESGTQRASVLTDRDGHFSMQAPVPGRYRLRAERIGHATTLSPFLQLESGTALEHTLDVPVQTVQLEGLVVKSARRRCATRADAGEGVATLWEEARKALNATAHTEEKQLFRFVTARFEREIDLRTRRVEREKRNTQTTSSSNPFVSISPEELQENGYVQTASDGESGVVYYAPDARVLLSRAFLDGHCFRIRAGEKDSEGQIGLAFEPVRGRSVPDIEGVLWVDARSAELRALEYRYTGLDLSGETREIGGRLDFQRLPSGAWVVRNWAIRMPLVGRQAVRWRGAVRDARERVIGLREEGGEVIEFVASDGRRFAGAARSTLAGTVLDGDRGAPLPGARVFLAGTEYATETDAEGRFRMEGVPEGRYSVGFSHPSLDSLGYSPEARETVLRRGRITPLALTLSRAAVMSALCPEALAEGEGAVAGAVRDLETGRALPGAEVSVTWRRYDLAGASPLAIHEEQTGFRVRSDFQGMYRVCGVPKDQTVTVHATLVDGRTGNASLETAPGVLLKQDVLLTPSPSLSQTPRSSNSPPDATSSAVFGTLLDALTGRPIPEAHISLRNLQIETQTDPQGRFRLEGLPGGKAILEVRDPRYGEQSRELSVKPGERLEVELRIAARTLELEPLTVRAFSRAELESRSRGVRLDRLTRAQIAELEPTARHVGDLIRGRFPNVRVREMNPRGIVEELCIETGRRMITVREGGASKCYPVEVYVNGSRIGDAGTYLLTLSPNAIESVELLTPILAGARYGTQAGRGVLEIYTRGNGPHAARDGRTPQH